MKKILSKLMASGQEFSDWALLFLRLFAGCMMLTHGWAKLTNFTTLSAVFPDPLGIGSTSSLVLILFAEVGCSLLLLAGLATRLATIPLLFGMSVALFVIHGADPFAVRELPLVYIGMYIVLLIAGGGRFSVDEFIQRKFIR